jgi:MFS family permease
MLFSMLNYIGFIFVPIVSIANNLSLSQVAIVFAVMRFPYIIDLFVNNFSSKKSKKKILFLILLFMSLLYLLLGYNESFRNILTITFGISLGLALMRPIISAYISDCTNPKEE